MKNAWEWPTLYGACDVKGMPAGKAHFIAELPDHRYLVCHSLNNLGCFEPKARTYVLLMDKIAKLHEYRYFVGAQNGLFALEPKKGGKGYECRRVEGMANNCIRSLVCDAF